MKNRTSKKIIWKHLNESTDLTGDLLKIYDQRFFERLNNLFDEAPNPLVLLDGTLVTARAYIHGWHKKLSTQSEFGVHTGRHILQAGIAAKRLEYHLRQLSKSDLAAFILNQDLENELLNKSDKMDSFLDNSQNNCGPARPMEPYRLIADSLARAVNGIIPLPDEKETEGESRARGDLLSKQMISDKSSRVPKLPAYYALECAALAFRPIWEQHSKGLYYKGRYDETKGGFYSRPASALHFVIREIDPEVKLTLVGTAIEKIRTQP